MQRSSQTATKRSTTSSQLLRPCLLASLLVALAACEGGEPPGESGQAKPAAAAEAVPGQALWGSVGIATELTTVTVPELVEQLAQGTLTAAELTQGYLARIDHIDRSGPTLRAVIAVNPDAVNQALASDERRAKGQSLGTLDGIPVLVKDNIETADPMPTTAGSLALENNITRRDSPLVAKLRAQGAVILGKTNLSQWANFRSDFSVSGWSSVGGQVKNPHILDRSPCGSSSGSGVAVAAGLAALAIGTETNGSIICPSNVNGIVGFKPTLGLLSQDRIIPISPSQDTAGPMARSVEGAALLLDAMLGESGRFSSELATAKPIENLTVAVMRFAQGDHPQIIERFNAAIDIFQRAGARVVEVNEFQPTDRNLRRHETEVLQTEFKTSLNAYLASTPDTVLVRNLEQLIDFNEAHADSELAVFGQDIFLAAQQQLGLDDPDYQQALAAIKSATGPSGIDQLLKDAGADILVAPSGPIAPPRDPINGDVWPSWVGIGYMAAIAGYPHLSIPMGTIKGIPIGLSIIGRAHDDKKLLEVGHQWQGLYGPVPTPEYLTTAHEVP